MDTGISNGLKNLKYFVPLILFPIFAFSALVVSKIVFAPQNFSSSFKAIKINKAVIVAEIADTPEKQAKGLSGRQSLAKNQGMLFVFDWPDYYSFWMKGMNFNLDFVWINNDKIVEITRNVKAEEYQPPKFLTPKEKVDKVLEINAGAADRLGIKEGGAVK